MEPSIIDVRGLVKRYGDKTVVGGITFSVTEGEIFGLLGPNGAGKSTTISILSTLILFDGGDVFVADLDLRSSKAAIKPLIGLVPRAWQYIPT